MGIFNSYKNPFRTIWGVKKWFKFPKPRFWVYKYYKWKNDSTPFIYFESRDVSWKDKFDSPRHERNPYFKVIFFRLFVIEVQFAYKDIYLNDSTYEQILWTMYYNSNDIKLSYKTWPWYTPDTNTTSWDKTMMTKRGLKEIKDVEWDTTPISHP